MNLVYVLDFNDLVVSAFKLENGVAVFKSVAVRYCYVSFESVRCGNREDYLIAVSDPFALNFTFSDIVVAFCAVESFGEHR